MYVAWMTSRGLEPLPFDIGWWKGWYEYTEADPEWNSAEFEAEQKRRMDAWKKENGYDE
jgi:hypothetical protein